jgi:hypothetical protein
MDATAAEAGIDPLELPLDRFLNWVYHWISSRLAPNARQAWIFQLERPGPGEVPPEWSDEAMTDTFLAATRSEAPGVSR